jgi:zinc transport system substrate-binding protein
MKLIKILSAIIFLSTIILSCTESDHKLPGSRPVIAVSIMPQKYFLEKIAGNRVTAFVLAADGQNPHSYEPTPAQMTLLARARAWVLAGIDFETSIRQKISLRYPSLMIVDGTSGVRFRHLEKRHDGEQAGRAHESDIDRHTWLGREPAKIMAGHIRDMLVSIDPEGKPVYDANYDKFTAEIDRLFNEMKEILKPHAGKKVFVFHPAFGYFLDEFGIEQVAVETGGREPSAKAIASLIARAKKEKPLAIFVQAQFPVNAAETVARSVGAEVVSLDPLAPEWSANIKRMGTSIEKSLNKK